MHLTAEQSKYLNAIIANVIDFYATGKQKITADNLFNKIWQLVYAQLLIGDANKSDLSASTNTFLYGPYQLNIREFLLLKIIKILKKHNIHYAPVLIVENNSAFDKIKQANGSAIVVSTHNGFAHIVKMFNHLGRSVTTIGTQPFTNQALSRSGVTAHTNIINRDRYCLAYLKKSIEKGELISSTVDFRLSETSNEDFKYISPALFAFAKKFTVPLYFLNIDVSVSGKVELSFKLAENSASPEETANQFIDYYNLNRSPKRVLSVKNY